MVAAAVMGVASLGAAALGANANKKATDKAVAASDRAAQSNEQLIREGRQMALDMVNPLLPYAYSGANALAARLGLGGATQQPQPANQPANALVAATSPAGPSGTARSASFEPQPDWAAYRAMDPGVEQEFYRVRAVADPNSPQWQKLGLDSLDQWTAAHAARSPDRTIPMTQPPAQQAATPAPTAPTPTTPADPGFTPAFYGDSPDMPDMPTFGPRDSSIRPDAGVAPNRAEFFTPWDENDAGYRSQRDQTTQGVNTGFAARGLLRSGGAAKALQDRLAGVVGQYMNDDFNRKNALYQAALGQFNADRAVLNSNFDVDMARKDARYDADRAFNYGAATDSRNWLASRFDKQTSDMFGLAGIGTGAMNAALGANSNATNAFMNNNNQQATTQGNAALAGAANTNALMGNALSAFGNAYGYRNASNSSVWGPKSTPAPAPGSGYTTPYYNGSMAGLY